VSSAAEELAATEAQDREVKRAQRKLKGTGTPAAKRRAPASKSAGRAAAKPAAKRGKR
jgi:hypothetical protein